MGGSFTFDGEFSGDTQTLLVSTPIAYNLGNVYRATVFMDEQHFFPSQDNFTISLSNNGGTDWQTATNGVEVTFATSGQDLRYKISAISGCFIEFEDEEATFPLQIQYVL
jgi:hypothetical protein